MDVSQYLFKSPSPNPVQIGRSDPSVKKEDVSAESKSNEPDQATQNAQNFEAQRTQDIKPVDTTQLLDIYV